MSTNQVIYWNPILETLPLEGLAAGKDQFLLQDSGTSLWLVTKE